MTPVAPPVVTTTTTTTTIAPTTTTVAVTTTTTTIAPTTTTVAVTTTTTTIAPTTTTVAVTTTTAADNCPGPAATAFTYTNYDNPSAGTGPWELSLNCACSLSRGQSSGSGYLLLCLGSASSASGAKDSSLQQSNVQVTPGTEYEFKYSITTEVYAKLVEAKYDGTQSVEVLYQDACTNENPNPNSWSVIPGTTASKQEMQNAEYEKLHRTGTFTPRTSKINIRVTVSHDDEYQDSVAFWNLNMKPAGP